MIKAKKTPDFEKARLEMVTRQLKQRHITSEPVLQAMAEVPRHSFVSVEYQNLAYKDSPLPIGHGQTISQPYIVAFMLQALALTDPAEATVLEIGTGLGYQAAVLAQFVQYVYTVERVSSLAAQAKQNFLALNYTNISISHGDGGCGWPKHAPYDGIVVSAAAPDVPAPLLTQLKPGASLVIPVGSRSEQRLIRITAQADGFVEQGLVPVAFVPLLGEHGWATASANHSD